MFAGANCTNPSKIIFLVPDSEWMAVGGEWILVGCPPCYFLDAGPKCSLCPAGFYCSGGRFPPSPCGVSRFTLPGASSASSCRSSVSVIVAVNVLVLRFEFDEETSKNLRSALSSVVNKSLEQIVIKTAEQSVTGKSTVVVSSIAAENEIDADILARQLDVKSVQYSLEMHGLEGGALLSVKLSACLPGYELDTSQICQPCLEKYFCVGGIFVRAACPTGSYSLSGANSSKSCFQVVFVVFSYSLPLPRENYTDGVVDKFRTSVANVARVPTERIVITSSFKKTQGRRVAVTSITLDAEVASDNAQSAATTAKQLDSPAMNAQLIAQGLPPGKMVSISVTEAVQSSNNNGSMLWIIVGMLLGSLLLVVAVMFRVLRRKESVEERSLQRAVTELLNRLHITRQYGFILSSESAPLWRKRNDFVVVQKSHAEAAARLSLLTEFDINQFDAFCLCLEGELGGYSVSVENLHQNRTQQYDLLCEWILEISIYLIRPEVVEASPEQSQTRPSTELRSDLRVEQRFPFLVRKVLKARVWEDSEYALFRRLQVVHHLK
jgi:hypothetical protein